VSGPEHPGLTSDAVLRLLRGRRVTRTFSSREVPEADLLQIAEAGRWAASASNNRLHRFLVVRDPVRIRLVRALSPGMLGLPPAMIAICTDMGAVAAAQVQVDKDSTVLIDVGTAAMNMMIQAHALGLGSCPTTSFSRAGVRTALALPHRARPELILQVGHRAEPRLRPRPDRSTRPRPLDDFVYRERYG
jgi:nitroreductase